MLVLSGGTVNSATVNAGGLLYVYEGGTASNITSTEGANIDAPGLNSITVN